MRSGLLFALSLTIAVTGTVAMGCSDDDKKASSATGNGGSGGGTAVTPVTFTCDAAETPTELPLRRLSHVQYTNTVHDVIERVLPGSGDEAMTALAVPLSKMPDDTRKEHPTDTRGGFRRLDQVVHQEHIDGSYEVGMAVGAYLTSVDRVGIVVGACAIDADATNDAVCVEDFIRRFGEIALRRPIDDDDLAFYKSVYSALGVDPQALSDVIAVMLAAPEFLYFAEHGGDQVEGRDGLYELSAYELAARLSYHFWQTIPDDELLEKARSGDLAKADVYEAQVDRLANDARTRSSLDSFFGEWLGLDDLPKMNALVGTPVFDAFRGDFTPSNGLRDAMVQEILDLSTYVTLTSGGTFEDLLTSRQSFAKTGELAGLYHAKTWSGKGEPPVMDDEARVGLITRAAFLATGSPNTRPILKGVFLRKGLLCDDIAPPPNNAAAVPPELSPDMTTREVVEKLTQQKGESCAGCHATKINPLGFATENFDSLGRFRTMQRLFDQDGNSTGEKPVDTTSVPQVEVASPETSSGAADLQRMMIDSTKPQACFARKYFRFTFGRLDDVTSDGCALEDVRRSIVDEKLPLHEVLARMAKTDAFRRRSFL